jgi:transcriptional regulator with XRE-family HTH domain
MNILRHIRADVFGLTQIEFAALTGVAQATISRWETGELHPGLPEMQRIRDEAIRRGFEWDDSLFFEAGASASHDGEAAAKQWGRTPEDVKWDAALRDAEFRKLVEQAQDLMAQIAARVEVQASHGSRRDDA